MTHLEHSVDNDSPLTRRRGAGGQLAVLLGLTGFAISMPLLAFLGESPTFFTFRGVGGLEIVMIGLLIAVVPALGLWAVGLIGGAVDRRVGGVIHLATCGVLTALAIVPFFVEAIPAIAAWVIGVAGAALLVWLYATRSWAGSFLRYLAVLPAISLGLFVFGSPSGELARADVDDVAAADDRSFPSVLFIVLDELPTKSLMDGTGEIDPVRFPDLAALAETSTWYPNNTALTPQTFYSVPAILTGSSPQQVEPLWTNYPESLFTMLAPTHELVVSESFTKLCGFEACVSPESSTLRTRWVGTARPVFEAWLERLTGSGNPEARDDFEEQFDSQDAAADGSFMAEVLEERRKEVLSQPRRHTDFLDKIEPTTRPTLFFEHLVMPHSPFRLYPDGTSYEPATVPMVDDPPEERWLAAVTEQRHLLQAEYTDRLMGQVVDRLEESGLFDDTMIVITADHGVSYDLGSPTRQYAPETLDGQAYVPLIIKHPGQEAGAVDLSNVDSLDLVPTVADTLGLTMPWSVDGDPIGSREVAERGDEKQFLKLDPFNAAGEWYEAIDYLGADHRPDASERWIGDIPSGADPITGLLDRLESADLIGVTTDSLSPEGVDVGLTAVLGAESAAGVLGTVGGSDEAERLLADEAEVLVAVDGTIVTGSAVYERDDGRATFLALLPAPLVGQAIEPELFVRWSDGSVEHVTVAP